MSAVATVSSGLCQCGCGQPTRIADRNNTVRGYVKGQPRPFLRGHRARRQDRWEARDCGHLTPCHLWVLHIDTEGYGRDWDPLRKVQRGAHVVAWEAVHGPVPEGMQLDHLCHDANSCPGGPTCLHRRCCNPEHLAPVTPAENSRRSNAGAHLRARTHCPQGHRYDGDNLVVRSGGKRGCRACISEWNRRDYLKRKAAQTGLVAP